MGPVRGSRHTLAAEATGRNKAMSTLSQVLQPCWTLRTGAVVLVGVLGCGEGIPKTYPVKGKVVFKGGKPVTDGRVQFQSVADPQFKALGDIDKDGSFSLMTYVESKRTRGAPAGAYQVVVELERPTKVVVLPSPYTVEPRENDFTIVIERPRR
jgi:hypothetical protein